MVLVMALYEACAAQRGHVIGTEVLELLLVDSAALHPQLIQRLHHGMYFE